jgi:hypothetical protein
MRRRCATTNRRMRYVFCLQLPFVIDCAQNGSARQGARPVRCAGANREGLDHGSANE